MAEDAVNVGPVHPDAPLGVVWAGSAWRSEGTQVFALVSRDLDREHGPRAMALDFFGHGFAVDPTEPARAAVFEKHGPGAAIVDLRRLACVMPLRPGPDREFYGHGAFSRDGALLFATEIVKDPQRRGALGVYDGRTGARVGELPSGGVAPHDCALVDEGRVLVVGNGGGALGQPEPPCVCWIDLADGRVLERRALPDARFDVGHLAIDAAGDLAIVSAPRFGTPQPERARGGLTLWPRGAAARTIDADAGDDALRHETVAAMIGETLSVALHEPTRTVASTNPQGHLLAFWDLDTGALRARLRVPNPRGVALTRDGSAYVVSFGVFGKLSRVDAHTLRPVDAPGNRDGLPTGATGSHLLVHHVAPAADAPVIALPL
ncbi:MAG: DUF1513 domain-containing protein [Nannocystaceae bacterium]|nr:DUF1513 domain-containing protein [Nannocystaceae bacterium]